jgi:hypothetical protein
VLKALFMALLLVFTLLTGCAAQTPAASPSAAPPQASSEPAQAVKTGLAFVTTLDKSKDAGNEDGLAQADAVIVGVTVDSSGKILRCVIDMIETKASFNTSGKITTPLGTAFMTKNEQGAGYGMAEASAIGREWDAQAAALSDYVVGKTADEIKGIAVDETGHAAGSDLKASVTIAIAGYLDAVLKAVENAHELGASASDSISVGVETNITYSKNAGPASGSVLIYATFTAITMDGGGVITSCLADGFQCAINFDASGKILSDLSAVPSTKNETGNAYGLKAGSTIGMEWYEQTAAFAKYVTGKTAEEVAEIAVNADTSPASSDLRATVTLKIGEFKKALAKAAALAD